MSTDTTSVQARVTVRQQRYEQLLCAATAQQPAYAQQTCGWLTAETFSDPDCRKFWQGFTQHGNVDRAALDANIYAALAEWRGDALVQDANAAPELARKVAEQAWLRAISSQLGTLAASIGDGDGAAARDVLRKMQHDGGLTPQEIPTVARTHEKFMAAIRNHRLVIPTYTKLDRYMGGLGRKAQTLLAGMTGSGKSALALQLARNVAASGQEVCFFSIEMSEEDLWARMACGKLRWNYDDIRAKAASKEGLSPEDDAALDKTSAALRDVYGYMHIYEEAQTTDSIWRHVATVRPALVVVDHVMLVGDKGENDTLRLGAITARFKAMAKALDCNVLTLVQLNRNSLTRPVDQRRPTLADVRQSGQITENADDLLALYRKDDEKPDFEGNVTAEVLFLKHRTGGTDAYAKFRYSLPEQWFYD